MKGAEVVWVCGCGCPDLLMRADDFVRISHTKSGVDVSEDYSPYLKINTCSSKSDGKEGTKYKKRRK